MPDTFGAELRRLAIGLTDHVLAYRAGLPHMTVVAMLHDRHQPSRAETEQVIAALGLVPGAGQSLRELAFLARGECCPRCHFGGEEET